MDIDVLLQDGFGFQAKKSTIKFKEKQFNEHTCHR